MIFVDGNYFARRFFHMAKAEKDNKNMDSMDFFRHTFLLNLNGIKYKFQKDYGDIVLCIDYKSWRKDFYPEYKDNRKEKDEDPLSLEFLKIFKDLYTLLETCTNIKVIKVFKAEADDIIFTLSKTEGKHLAYSGDKDIFQCISENCDFYDFNTKAILKMDDIRKKINLRKHILMGDSTDNIKNIAWNSQVSKEFNLWFRKKFGFDITIEILYKKIVEKDDIFNEFEKETNLKAFKKVNMGKVTTDKYLDDENLKLLLNSNPILKNNYAFNTILIDMEKIPNIIKEQILAYYYNYPKKSVNMEELFKYCDKYNLNYVKDRLKYLVY